MDFIQTALLVSNSPVTFKKAETDRTETHCAWRISYIQLSSQHENKKSGFCI